MWVCCKLNHVYCDGPFYGPECHHNSYHHNEDYHPYSRTISKTKGDHHFYYTIPRTATILDQTLNNYTGQPCMVNPNSAEAVVEIITNVENTGSGGIYTKFIDVDRFQIERYAGKNENKKALIHLKNISWTEAAYNKNF